MIYRAQSGSDFQVKGVRIEEIELLNKICKAEAKTIKTVITEF